MTSKKTCESIQAHLSAYILQTLDSGDAEAVRDHVHTCDACKRLLELEQGRLAILDALPREEAPTNLAERTLARIDEATSEKSWFERILPPLVAAATLGILAAIVLPVLTSSREAARRASAQNTMKQLGLCFKMFANQSPSNQWPTLASLDTEWSPELEGIYPEILADANVLVSPSHPDVEALAKVLEEANIDGTPDYELMERVMGESFGYLGYSITDEQDFLALQEAKSTGQLSEDSNGIPGADPNTSIFPIREGIERFLITDINNPAGTSKAQSSIPVLVEISQWKHKKSKKKFKGANVLYMDGHVAFVSYGTFPVVDSVLDALSGIAEAQ